MKKCSTGGLKVVTIGGGTGSSVFLKGLKKYTTEITAIVTVADDGGGSGVLREDLGMLPPGDIRACLIALAGKEPVMEKVMNYRFPEGMLSGQSFGNLFLAAMTHLYGSFDEGLRQASNVLAITGKVLPMTLEDVVLYAELEDGSTIQGESNITFLTRKTGGRIKRVFIEPELSAPMPEAIEAIYDADVVIIGPGSLYTSIIPNLLVKEIAQALIDTTAPVVYVVNVMTQSGETDGYSAYDHLQALQSHVGEPFVDFIAVNNEEIPLDVGYRYYYKDKSTPIYLSTFDREKLEAQGIGIIDGPFIEDKRDYICHDADLLSKTLIQYFRSK